MSANSKLTYRAAGVDIDAGEALVERIKGPVRETLRPEVLGELGGFGGLFRVPAGYKDPLLVAATDGVGTKLKLAIEHDAHDEVGIDLVAMCVNDLIVQGAEPLFFLDYFSTPKLEVDVAERVIKGIVAGCKLAGASLIGGETAEHPGTQASVEYDLAGFCVGIVDRPNLIDGESIRSGDAILGIASSGVHSNGFSLIRHILEQQPQDIDQLVDGRPLIEQLLTPTRIYVRSLLELFAENRPKGLAHITGGGLSENIPRVLPDGLGAVLDESAWSRSGVFDWLMDAGVAPREMRRTFNCGVGMVAIVAPEDAQRALAKLADSGERAWQIGEIVADDNAQVVIR